MAYTPKFFLLFLKYLDFLNAISLIFSDIYRANVFFRQYFVMDDDTGFDVDDPDWVPFSDSVLFDSVSVDEKAVFCIVHVVAHVLKFFRE